MLPPEGGGLDFFGNGFKAALTYFQTDFEDKIITDYLTDGSKTWKNLGDATLSGFESEFPYDLEIGSGKFVPTSA